VDHQASPPAQNRTVVRRSCSVLPRAANQTRFVAGHAEATRGWILLGAPDDLVSVYEAFRSRWARRVVEHVSGLYEAGVRAVPTNPRASVASNATGSDVIQQTRVVFIGRATLSRRAQTVQTIRETGLVGKAETLLRGIDSTESSDCHRLICLHAPKVRGKSAVPDDP